MTLLLAPLAVAAALTAAPKDGGAERAKDGYGITGLVGTDAGVRDGGVPFSGFDLGKPLTAQGDPSKNEIQPVVKARQGEINACYLELLKRHGSKQPLPQGTAVLQFEVSPEGKVAAASLGAASDIKDPAFATCAAEKVKAWVFPPPRGGAPVKVGYPMKLRPPD